MVYPSIFSLMAFRARYPLELPLRLDPILIEIKQTEDSEKILVMCANAWVKRDSIVSLLRPRLDKKVVWENWWASKVRGNKKRSGTPKKWYRKDYFRGNASKKDWVTDEQAKSEETFQGVLTHSTIRVQICLSGSLRLRSASKNSL